MTILGSAQNTDTAPIVDYFKVILKKRKKDNP